MSTPESNVFPVDISDSTEASGDALTSALGSVVNPPTTAEAQSYARKILQKSLSGGPEEGEASLFKDLHTNAENARQALQEARARLMQQQITPREQQMARLAAAFAPTKTGVFGEGLENQFGTEHDLLTQKRQFEAQKGQQDLGLATQLQGVDANVLQAKLALQKIHESQQNTLAGKALTVLGRSISPTKNPGTGANSPIGKMVTDRLGPNALQTPEGQALFDKLLQQKDPAQSGTLNQHDIDLLGDRYYETGQIPAVGMGKDATALRQQIIHSATQRATGLREPLTDTSGQGASAAIAGNAATLKATGATLLDMSKRTAIADASEHTASTNLDLAYNLMTKADQSGSPLINSIQNKIRSGLLGDPDVSAYVNALTTASNEYARVVSMAMGAQGITDAARKEGHDLFNPSLAPDQLRHNLEVARKEMANRTASLHEEITHAKRSLYGIPKPDKGSSPGEGSQDHPDPLGIR